MPEAPSGTQFTQAQQLFAAIGEVSALRGRLPRLPAPEVSAKLAHAANLVSWHS